MGSTDEWFESNGTNINHAFGANGSGVVAYANDVHYADSRPYPAWIHGGRFVGTQWGVLSLAFPTTDTGTDWPPLDSYSNNAGLFAASAEYTGVVGLSTWGAGVYGRKSLPGDHRYAWPSGLAAGVVGTSYNWSGVIGWSGYWYGVEGHTFAGDAGVLGIGDQARGVFGICGSGTLSGVEGRCGDAGPTVPNTSNIAAVVGTSNRQHGVIGTTNANVGVIGFSTNNIGVLGYTTKGSFAGYFLGNLGVTGTKAAVVPFPDGTHRALYCMESPELWFEDFGTAKLRRGRAVVKLDADFGKVIKRGDYRVFLPPEGDCRGLHTRRKSATSFEVRESQGGKSSIAFSYRIVGRRKDIAGPPRFAKVIPPMLPAAAVRAPRKPTAAGLRAFVARLEREARARRPKVAKKSRRSRTLPSYLSRQSNPMLG